MTLHEYCSQIEKFLQDYLEKSGAKCYILGLSGGVDSSLVAALARQAVGKDRLFCYTLPIHSDEKDETDAFRLAKMLDVNIKKIDLSSTYESYLKEIDGENFSRLTKGNLKVRMRMCALYAQAQEKNGLVLGTDNYDENYVGYFTKYGDGACDLLPIVSLTKLEVREAAKFYGVSEELAHRTPTAGLYKGQTDEKEMGVTYDELDAFLLGKEVSKESKERIEHLHKVSAHKRDDIPRPAPLKRN